MRFTRPLAFTLLLFASSVASAGLFIDVRAVPGIGYVTNASGDTVTVCSADAVVNFELFGTLTDGDGIASNDLFGGCMGSLIGTRQSGGSITGNLQLPPGDYSTRPYPCYTSPFNESVNPPPAVQDLNADGFRDIGGSNPASSEGFFNTLTSPVLWVVGAGTYTTGTFQFAVESSPDAFVGSDQGERVIDEVVTWQRRNAYSAFSAKIDGHAVNGNNWADYVTIGPGVEVTHCVPEPSSLVLLAAGVLAFIVIRRRK